LPRSGKASAQDALAPRRDSSLPFFRREGYRVAANYALGDLVKRVAKHHPLEGGRGERGRRRADHLGRAEGGARALGLTGPPAIRAAGPRGAAALFCVRRRSRPDDGFYAPAPGATQSVSGRFYLDRGQRPGKRGLWHRWVRKVLNEVLRAGAHVKPPVQIDVALLELCLPAPKAPPPERFADDRPPSPAWFVAERKLNPAGSRAKLTLVLLLKVPNYLASGRRLHRLTSLNERTRRTDDDEQRVSRRSPEELFLGRFEA
jgi:hypothetical protein